MDNLTGIPDASRPARDYDWDKLKAEKVSCYMVCRDEKPFIDLAIQSVAPFIEDFVIVDTGSKDGTDAIIKQFAGQFKNIRYFERRIHNFDLSEIRNYAMAQCQYNNIMVCDGDEVYDEAEILKIKKWFSVRHVDFLDAGRFGARLLSVRPIGDFKKAEADIYMVRLIRRQADVQYKRIWPADDIFYGDFPLFCKMPYINISLFHLASVKPYHERLRKWATYHALSTLQDKLNNSEIPDYFSMADMRETAQGVNHVSCLQAPPLVIPVPKILFPHIARIEKEAANPML